MDDSLSLRQERSASSPSTGRSAQLSKPSRLRRRLLSFLQLIALPLGAVAAWEIAGRAGLLSAGILPWPSLVFEGWYIWVFGATGFGLNAYSGTWVSNVINSSQRVFQGYALAILIGVPLGVLIGWNRLVARLIDPTIQGLRPVPITAWLPFSIAVFGIRDMGAIFLIGLGAVYPIIINSAHGARDVNKNLLRAALMLGATQRQVFFHVVFRSALPAIFTGLRLGIGIAWTIVIVAEMVAVKSGLGYVLWDAYYVGRMEIVVADMISIGVLGFLSDRVIVAIENQVLYWKKLQRV